MTQRLLIATGNAGKVREIRHELAAFNHAPGSRGLLNHLEILALTDIAPANSPLPECLEDRPTFIGNATKKARHFAALTGLLTLADDSGLCVDALDGAPGVFSARYAGVSGHQADAANNAKLLAALASTPDDRRHARFVCAIALALPAADLAVTQDEVHGILLREPRGTNGFGYDPLFFFPEFNQTTAQLDPAAKGAISHRGKALRRMLAWLGNANLPNSPAAESPCTN